MVALREIAEGLVDNEVVLQEDIVEETPLFAAFEDNNSEEI